MDFLNDKRTSWCKQQLHIFNDYKILETQTDIRIIFSNFSYSVKNWQKYKEKKTVELHWKYHGF